MALARCPSREAQKRRSVGAPAEGGGWFRDNGVGEGCQGKSAEQKNFGNQKFPKWDKERIHHGGTEDTEKRWARARAIATGDCAEDADRILYVRSGLRPARKPSAEWNGFSLFAFPASTTPASATT